MRGDAIKHVAACACAGIEPSKSEQADALAEAVDMLVGFLVDVTRIADAVERAIPRDDDPSNP